MTVTPIPVAASGDDAHYGYEGPAHPPTTSDALSTGDTIGVLQRSTFSSSAYRIIHGFLRFDTSTIPTDAAINSITLRVYINATGSANSPSWVGALIVEGTLGARDYAGNVLGSGAWSVDVASLTGSVRNDISVATSAIGAG